MSNKKMVNIDGNEAAAYVAHKTNEVIAIYPITPSSTMAELADEWSDQNRVNIWNTIPRVTMMQSEAGAAAAVHGALQTGALTTTFTASQGLLLMIPNMFKIAGELSPAVFHVSARSLAAQALSIFGDHGDVMAVRQTGFGMLCSNSIQEVMDMALIAQASTLESRIPFVHFFDGFRTSHEVMKVEQLSDDDIKAMIDDDLVIAHRQRGLSSDHPVLRGTSQNPDVYFQARETVNPFYEKTAEIVQKAMDKLHSLTGRQYKLFDYIGDPDAERIIVIMGSGAETIHETVEYLNSQGEKVGAIKVRLFRPFSVEHLISALPKTTKKIAVLDRCKEPGSLGEPLYQDILTAIYEAFANGKLPMNNLPVITGGRYGLSSKEFTTGMAKGVFDELAKEAPKKHFTVGIRDDVSHTSIDYDADFSIESEEVFRGLFFGLGSDGTVGANKNSIKIIGEETDNYTQGYFVYDSKKSGSMTVSHLRFGKNPIRSTFLINKANFIACHHFSFLETVDVLKNAEKGAIFLLNSPFDKGEVWDKIPKKVQQTIIDKELKFYVIDAFTVAREAGMGQRTNTIMQTCFFAISGILPKDEAIEKIKNSIKKTYGSKGDQIVTMNYAAVDQALSHLHEVDVPKSVTSKIEMPPPVPAEAPEFVRNVLGKIIAWEGDELPVSAMPCDGTFPTGTTKWEKRNVALSIPVWEPDLCTQCNKCAMVCPHAAIRAKIYSEDELAKAPSTFKSLKFKAKGWPEGTTYTIQVAPEDCTGCEVCVEICPAKDKKDPARKSINMHPQPPLREQERENFSFFLNIPEYDRSLLKHDTVKGAQFLEPLFEFSGACSGCGETPYIKLASQLFGDRMIVGNATGCSSIYGGNLPTTPWTTNADGRGPSWSNSLFEDTSEFALGFRLTLDKQLEHSTEILKRMREEIGGQLVDEILNATQIEETDIFAQRERVTVLKEKLAQITSNDAKHLLSISDSLVKKSVWAMGGDGWAYDIGYGGLDHVLATGKNVNILVMDTEVYSNTGGQVSKASPTGAIAKFAAGGKKENKKDLAMMAMSYGNVYVAKIAMGASDIQTLRAFIEADRYEGTSIIIAYSQCIAHGYDLKNGMGQAKLAVESGHWPIFRYNPMNIIEGKNPLKLDCKPPKIPLKDYIYNENRYKMLLKKNPQEAGKLLKIAEKEIAHKWYILEQMATYMENMPTLPGLEKP